MSFKYIIFDPRAPRRFWRFFVYFYLLGILFFSVRPDYSVSTDPNWISVLKNLLHIPAYAGLTFFLLCGLGRTRWQTKVLAFLIAIGYGALNEFFQGFVPGRSCSLDDFLRNAAGALLVVLVVRQNPILLAIERFRKIFPR